MLAEFNALNFVTGSDRLPAGGYVQGVGLDIEWQSGPLGAPDDPERQEPNGAFVETVIAAAKQRIEFYQSAAGGRFACRENAMAITKLDEALMWLNKRTADRTARNVEGTHEK
jgi:hypothetical protein